MVRKNNWASILFFIAATTGALVGAPWYLWHSGLSSKDVFLFIFFIMATSLSITVGYHRLFSHASYKTNAFIRFLVLFFGAAAFEQSALTWSSTHRDHHRHADTDLDPYGIKKGFFHAHMGWMLFWKHEPDFSNVKDLMKDDLVNHQHRYYPVWAILAGVLFPMAIGALQGRLLAAFIFTVCVRLTLVHHATFCINSFAHKFGTASHNAQATARDNWFMALLTNGEGYHNFHHCFPTDYRNGIRWYHWDPSKWTIALLAYLGLAWDLQVSRTMSLKPEISRGT